MKSLTITALLLISLQLFAQENQLKTNVANIVQRDDKLILNFTSDNWSNLPSYIKSKPIRSRGFSFLLMNERMSKTGQFGFGTGLGFMSQNVHTNAIITDTTVDESSSVFITIPDSLNYKCNKLSLNFITAAFEIRLRTKENSKGERFKLSAGILAGYLLQSHTKYQDKNDRFKTYKIEHLNKFQYGIAGRIGYSNYALYGYYSLVDVFKEGEGPELIPYSIGISFTF